MPTGLLAPPQSNGGLLDRVIWDRLRSQRGTGLLGTEGVGTPNAGGGGRAMQTELPLQGGRTISRNVRVSEEPEPLPPWNWDVRYSGTMHVATTPSGARVMITQDGGVGSPADVMFSQPSVSGAVGSTVRNPSAVSTKQSIRRFTEVTSALKDFIARNDPSIVSFSGSTDNHSRFYSKVGPELAKELGGHFDEPEPGIFEIRLHHGYDD